MTEAPMDSPYRGLVPYNEGDARFFFGREAETRLVVANLCSAQLTLLYGPSGVGKSSILRAGVMPRFRLTQYASIPIYFNRWKGDPLLNLEEAIIEAIRKESLNVTVGKDLVSDCLKQIQTKRSSLDPLAGVIEVAATVLKRRLIVILDQFDEYFLYQPEPHADRLGPALASALAQPKSQISFLVSLRDDSLSQLDRFEGDIPSLFDNYLRLEHLDREAAAEAITKPLPEFRLQQDITEQASEVHIEPELIEAVLDDLSAPGHDKDLTRATEAANARIKAPELQLVMTRLWQEDVVRRRGLTLRRDTLQKLGGLKKITRNHLNEVMLGLSWRQRRLAIRLFKWIVSSSGKKISETPNRLAELAQVSRTKTIKLLERLEELRILNSFEVRAGDGTSEVNYEIYHSFLADPILEWRRQYRLKVRIISLLALLSPPVVILIFILQTFNLFSALSDILVFAICVLILLAPLQLGFLIGRWWERAK